MPSEEGLRRQPPPVRPEAQELPLAPRSSAGFPRHLDAGLERFNIGISQQRQAGALAIRLLRCDHRVVERIPRPLGKST